MRLDTHAEEFIEWQQSLKMPPLMTPDGLYYYQLIEDGKFVLVPKDHPLMKMTNEEFIASLDDAFYDELAELTYQEALRVCSGGPNEQR